MHAASWLAIISAISDRGASTGGRGAGGHSGHHRRGWWDGGVDLKLVHTCIHQQGRGQSGHHRAGGMAELCLQATAGPAAAHARSYYYHNTYYVRNACMRPMLTRVNWSPGRIIDLCTYTVCMYVCRSEITCREEETLGAGQHHEFPHHLFYRGIISQNAIKLMHAFTSLTRKHI